MEQTVRIRKVLDDGTALVIPVWESACSGDCHQCSGCNVIKEPSLLLARNPIGAGPGALVKLRSETVPVMKAALVLYILPLLLFFGGYRLGMLWNIGALLGCLAFAAGIGMAVAYDRLVASKKGPVYTITGYKEGFI